MLQMLTELGGFMSPVSVVKFVNREKLVVGCDGGQLDMFDTTNWHKYS